MVTKGIITSIDFNGNTCQVRIPLFETAGNDPITGTAIVSNTPGSYNGYKVGDVVLVAFEDGKMQSPVIVGKLYLGAAKEKQDPRGTINVETTTASKSASLPADAVLTANVDSNVPNTNTPFGSLASIANNLNSLNTDVNQLDRFTRNQFNSVITDVNDQGEQLRSEIKQTAENIEANVVHTHKDGSQDALGWDLTTDSWKISAQDTVNGKVKDINIVTIDRNGMSIAGDLKLSGYPKNTTIMYAQNGSDESYPTPLYKFTEAEFPTLFPSGDEDKDKTWYYGKYIKITEAGEEKYVLIFKENFEYYSITVGTTKAYNRKVNSEVWSTKTPKRDDGQYIWQWTHTEIYSFDGDKWDEQDDDKVVCITGAKGENGAEGKPGASTYTISIDNDFDSVPADVNGNVSSSYPWESETKHNVRVYYGKEAQDFTIVDQNGTASSTGLCLKYKLTNVTLKNAPSINDKVATASIKDLSADAGNILYTLYIDGVETGITGKFSVTKIKSPAPTYTISIDNDFATIPTSIVNNKIYRNAHNKFVPTASGYNRETITVAGIAKKLPGMKLSAVKTTTKLKDALLQKPAELITDTNKSYVEDITKHNVTVYCNDDVETITADNFIIKLDSDGLDANMDETQNYLVCELGGFDSTGARATDFPGMNPTVSDNVVTNYITALSALGDASESKNVYIQYTYYVKGELVATAKFEVTRHTGPTTYYLSSNVSTIKVNKNVSPATITPDTVTCTAYRLDTSTNTNTRFTNGTWKYKWDNGTWSPDTSTASDLKISTADVITNKYKQLYIELYLDNQLWDRETIDVIADGENAIDYKILVDNGQIKRDPNDHTEDTSSVTFSFYKWNGSTRSNFNGAHFNYYINGVGPTPGQCSGSTNTFTVNADSNPAISSITKNIKVELLDKQNGTVVESETIDVVINGSNGLYIKNTKQWYKLVAKTDNDPTKPTTDIVKSDENGNPTHTTNEGWSDIPLDAINDMNLWTSLESIFSDDTSEKRHIEFSDPVKDATYALAQGKTTNYYSPTEPIYNVKKGDCWFDTGYVNVGAFGTKAEYLGKFVISTAGDILVEQDENDSTRYIQNATGSTKLIKVTPENINTLIKNKTIVVDTTEAFETGNLKQCSGFNEDTKKAIWEDIAGELVTNKLTANYINAMDITSKKIEVLDSNNDTLFLADGIDGNGEVNIGGWKVNKDKLYSGANTKAVSLQSNLDKDSYVDCIIANGKQFIDTGIWLNFNTDSIEITYQPTKNQEGVVFGNGANLERAALCLSGLNNAVNFYIGHVIDQTTEQKTLKTYINTTNLNKQTIKIQKETVTNIKGELENRLVLYVNDIATSYEVCIGEWSRTNWTLYIAAGNNNGGGAYSDFFGKIYGCKIWRNDELIRDYVPYYQASSKKYGLFDNCSKEFKASDSGSEFDGEASSIYVGSEDSSNAPFSISNTGSVRASDVVLKGYIMSDGGNIGGFNITDNTLTAGTFSSNDFIAIASKNALEARVANIKDYYKLIIGPNFGVTKKGDVHIGSGKFTGEISAESGKLSGIESIECLNSLKIGPVELTPVNFMESSIADQTVAFTIETGRAAYIGSSTIYYVTITSSQKLAKAIQLPYRLTYATYLGTYGGTSSYNNKTQNIYFNKVITFPANTTTYEISTIADSYDQYGSWRLVDIQVSQIGAVVDAWDPDHNWFTCKAPVNSTAEAWALKFSQNLVPNSTEAKLSLGVSNQAWDKIYCKSAHAEQFYASSDLRLKENIKEFSPQKSILDLPVVEFDFKDSGKHQIGCIAQDLQKLFPELVETEENGYLTIAENKLVYLLLLEIKKLNAKIENLSTTNKSKGGHK